MRIETLPICPEFTMSHSEHNHIHCEFCGHLTIRHESHIDYLHDGELHYSTDSGEIYPHKLAVSQKNPAECNKLYQHSYSENDFVNKLIKPDTTAEQEKDTSSVLNLLIFS